ncbi:hypothetical protein V8E55_001566 [Tylopilus felleus]
MLPAPMTPRRMAIARMDEEIARPTDTLSNLEKNTLCFIYRLPTETLEAIFIQNAHDYFRDARGWRCGPIVPSWVNVSYVSRHWRNVALNCATLWTYLFVTTPRWTEELLARSKQASLKLDVYACGRDEERRVFRFLEQVMDHVKRIQELYLDLAIEPHDAFLSKLCSRAPRLQHLQLMCKSYYSDWSSISFQDPPALRTLRLMHCSVPLDSFKLSGLTKLNLRQVPVRFQQDITEFLAVLSCMENLHHLHLHDALASAIDFLSSAAFHSFQKIDLLHLSQLLIFDQLSTVITLLSCINIPSKTEVRLAPDFNDSHNSSLDEYAQLYSLLEQRYGTSKSQNQAPGLSVPTIRSLVIACSEPPLGSTDLSFHTSERDVNSWISASCSLWGHGIPLRISLAYRQSINDRMHLLNRVYCSMPLSHIQSVHVINPPLPVAFWTEILGCLPDLRHLKISEGFMPKIIPILSLSPHNTASQDGLGDRGRDRIFVPTLEELELDRITFSAPANIVTDDGIPFEVTSFQSLSDALSTRKEPRGRLTITRCVQRTSHGMKMFDLDGWWCRGRFCTVSYMDNDYDVDDEDEDDEDEDGDGEEDYHYYESSWDDGDEEDEDEDEEDEYEE